MADIINNPDGNRSGMGGLIAVILGIVVLVLMLLLFFPNLFTGNRADTGDTVNVQETNGEDTGTVVIPPPTVNNTTINSTSTLNLNGTTTDEDAN